MNIKRLKFYSFYTKNDYKELAVVELSGLPSYKSSRVYAVGKIQAMYLLNFSQTDPPNAKFTKHHRSPFQVYSRLSLIPIAAWLVSSPPTPPLPSRPQNAVLPLHQQSLPLDLVWWPEHVPDRGPNGPCKPCTPDHETWKRKEGRQRCPR